MGELYNLNPRLPKNIRQIGERDQVVKLYVEDYVNTYLRRLYPAGGEDLRCGLLLGSEEEGGKVPYIFIDGALEMEGVACGKEQVDLNDQAWKRAYRDMEEMFPKRSVQGWFLCGAPGCQLSPLNYWKQHSKYFPGKNKIMYLNSGLEGEEALYMASDDGFYRLRGYCVYYERNQMMQDYMIARKDVKRVDAGVDDGVIRDFRRRMDEKREEARERRSAVSVLGGICGVLSVAVLAGGIVMVNNYQKMRDMESVLASVMPAGAEYLPGGEEEKPELVLETGVTVQPETMTAGMPEPPETGAAASEPAASGTAEAVSGAAASKPAETGAAVSGTAAAESAAAAEPSKAGAAASEPAASGAAEARERGGGGGAHPLPGGGGPADGGAGTGPGGGQHPRGSGRGDAVRNLPGKISRSEPGGRGVQAQRSGGCEQDKGRPEIDSSLEKGNAFPGEMLYTVDM